MKRGAIVVVAVSVLGADRVACVCSDDYHRYGRKERAARGITPLHPDCCNHLDILEQHLGLLRRGQPILRPVYDHRDGTTARREHEHRHEREKRGAHGEGHDA